MRSSRRATKTRAADGLAFGGDLRERAAMPNLDFFAIEPDQRALIEFLFSGTDVRVFESYSVRSGTARVPHLRRSPSVMDELTITRFAGAYALARSGYALKEDARPPWQHELSQATDTPST